MPFVHITTTQPLDAQVKQQLLQRTSDTVVEALVTPLPSVRIVLQELPQGNYLCAGQFDVPAVLFDIDMIEGRSEEAKAKLIAGLSKAAHEIAGVDEAEIRVRMSDFPKENMGMAGGISAKAAGR